MRNSPRSRSRGGPFRSASAVASLGVSLALAGCAGEMDVESAGSRGEADTGGRNGDDTWWPPPDSGGPGDEEMQLTAPVASGRFVFIANTTNGTLARVSLEDRAIQISTVRVGAEPTIVRPIPEEDGAVVLNEGSDSVSIVRAGEGDAADSVVTIPVLPACNELAVSPDGGFAFAWYSNSFAEPGDRTGSLSEISAIRLEPGDVEVFQVSVGINVRSILYDRTGDLAFVVSDDGISPMELASLGDDGFVPPIPMDAPGEAPPVGTDREVAITDDGGFALMRVAGAPRLRVIRLADHAFLDLELDGEPSDIDLVPGTAEAVLSVRSRGAVGVLDLDAFVAGDDGAVFWLELPEQPVEQTALTPDGSMAVVFSRAADSERLTVIDLATRNARTVALRKGIQSVIPSPDSRRAIVIHSKQPGEPVAGDPEDEIIARSFAFSAIDLASPEDAVLSKLVRVDAMPTEVAWDAGGAHAFVLVADEARGARQVAWVDMTSFQTDTYRFDLPTEHIGYVPDADVVFVSQTHSLGRIAFIDIATDQVREITGFELNALIE